MIENNKARLLMSALLVGLFLTGGCASSPPVQEMSDARQAIAAAREAGAADYDAEALRTAESRLAEAESQLQQRIYRAAKKSAVSAKESAIAALLRSRSLRESGAQPPVAPVTR